MIMKIACLLPVREVRKTRSQEMAIFKSRNGNGRYTDRHDFKHQRSWELSMCPSANIFNKNLTMCISKLELEFSDNFMI